MKALALLSALGALLSGCGGGSGGGNSSGGQGQNPTPVGDACLREHALLKQGGAFGDNYPDAVRAFAVAASDCGATKAKILARAREMLTERYGEGESR